MLLDECLKSELSDEVLDDWVFGVDHGDLDCLDMQFGNVNHGEDSLNMQFGCCVAESAHHRLAVSPARQVTGHWLVPRFMNTAG